MRDKSSRDQRVFIGTNRALHVWKEAMLLLIMEGHTIQSVTVASNGDGLIVVNPDFGGIPLHVEERVVDLLMISGRLKSKQEASNES